MKNFMIERKKHTFGILKKMSFDNFQFLILASLFLFTSQIGISAVKVTDISAGGNHTLILKIDDAPNINQGSLWAVGDNTYGQLGDGSNTNTHDVKEILSTGVTKISAGENHSLLIKNDGSLWSMGLNSSGQLGDGTTDNNSTPEKIIDANVSAISAGANHSLYLDENGSLWVMGLNRSGQLGDGTTDNKSTPLKIRDANVSAIAAGTNHSLYLDENGSLWAFGDNTYGQLGDGTEDNRSSPVLVEASGVDKVFAGGNASFYIKSDGSVWAMGDNTFGQLGDSTNWNRNRAVRVFSANENIRSIAGGANHNFFITNSGEAYGVGLNDLKQLGYTGNTTSTPVQPTFDNSPISGISSISAGGQHSLFLRNDGSIFGAGRNDKGQLGLGNEDSTSLTQGVKAYNITIEQPDNIIYEPQNSNSTMPANTLSGEGLYVFGDPITYIAEAKDGFVFKEWKSGEVTLSQNSPYSTTVSSDLNLEPIFAIDENDDDNDLLNNYLERIVWGTESDNNDSDGDGFNDFNETNIVGLNPTSPDTDLRAFFLESEVREYNEGNLSGVQYVHNNLSQYGYFTTQQKVDAYSDGFTEGNTTGYDQGFTEGNHTGIEYAQANPSEFNFLTDAEKNVSYNQGFAEGNESGIQYVQNNKTLYELVTLEEHENAIEDAKAEAKAEALAEVQADLATQGLSSLTYLNQITGQSTPHTDGWYYQPGLGWLWTNRDQFPFIYKQGDEQNNGGWLFFSQLPDHKDKPLWDYELQDWISISGN